MKQKTKTILLEDVDEKINKAENDLYQMQSKRDTHKARYIHYKGEVEVYRNYLLELRELRKDIERTTVTPH